jgi:iron complex transport system permease protein
VKGLSKKGTLFTFIAIALVAVTVFALSVGSANVSSAWSAIFHPSRLGSSHEIIWGIRFPRILTALLVGAALGAAGALSQAATNNPLADPSIIGTSAGASAGAAIAVLANIAPLGTLPITLFAIIGALVASLATFALARSAFELLIVGIATSALLSAITGLAISMVARPDARSISFWSLGSLALANMETVKLIAPLVLIGVLAAWYYSKQLNLLALGDREVRYLGFNPRRLRFFAFIVISILIATSVSAVGSIAFLALAAPHITRFIIGPSNRPLIIGSTLLGALTLLVADTVARTIAPPHELPIGLITSLIGAPILILVLRKNSGGWR